MSSPDGPVRPPRRITLPDRSSSSLVFSSSRNPRPSPSSVSPPIGRPESVASEATELATRRRRAALNEDQLARHGAGAVDLRASLLHAKTPAGFIPFDSRTHSTHPRLGSPPSYNPDENPFFPPVVLLGGQLPSMSGSSRMFERASMDFYGAPLHPAVPHALPPLQTSPLLAAADLSQAMDVVDPSPPLSDRSEAPTLGTRSSTSSSATLVSTTDMAVNSSLPRRPRPRSTASHSTNAQKGLSLTELFAADWADTSGSASSRRRERRVKENTALANKSKASGRERRTKRVDGSSSSGSESDCQKLGRKAVALADPIMKTHAKLTPGRMIDSSIAEYPTKLTPD